MFKSKFRFNNSILNAYIYSLMLIESLPHLISYKIVNIHMYKTASCQTRRLHECSFILNAFNNYPIINKYVIKKTPILSDVLTLELLFLRILDSGVRYYLCKLHVADSSFPELKIKLQQLDNRIHKQTGQAHQIVYL